MSRGIDPGSAVNGSSVEETRSAPPRIHQLSGLMPSLSRAPNALAATRPRLRMRTSRSDGRVTRTPMHVALDQHLGVGLCSEPHPFMGERGS